MGWGDYYITRVLASEARGPEFYPQHLHKKVSIMVYNCNPGTEEVETGVFLSFTAWPLLAKSVSYGSREKPCFKKLRWSN